MEAFVRLQSAQVTGYLLFAHNGTLRSTSLHAQPAIAEAQWNHKKLLTTKNIMIYQAVCVLALFLSLIVELFRSRKRQARTMRWNPYTSMVLMLQAALLGALSAELILSFGDRVVLADIYEVILSSIAMVGTVLCVATWCCTPSGTATGLYNLSVALIWSTRSYNGVGASLPMDVSISVLYWTACLTDIMGPYSLPSNELALNRVPFFQRLSFVWIEPLIQVVRQKGLRCTDLWELGQDFSVQETLHRLLTSVWKNSRIQVSFLIFLWRGLTTTMLWSGILELVSVTTRLLQPWVLKEFLRHPSVPIVLAMFVTRGLYALSNTQSLYFLRTDSLRVQSALNARIYEKTLSLSSAVRSHGNLATNLAAVDTQRIGAFFPHLHSIWSSPLQVVVSLVCLSSIIGWRSVLGSCAILILSIPVVKFFSNRMSTTLEHLMQQKDERTRLLVEVLEKIKTIKLHAWQPSFLNKVDIARRDELGAMKTVASVQALMFGITNMIPELVTAIALLLSFWTKRELSSQVIFPALGFFVLLKNGLSSFQEFFFTLLPCTTSFQRIMEYLSLEEQDWARVSVAIDDSNPPGIIVAGATFERSGKQILHVPRLDIGTRLLMTISGPVGSGKTTLLKGLTGLTPPAKGTILVAGSIAYAPQTPWLMNSSLRDNILCGRKFEPHFYRAVLESCALDIDLQNLPQGDLVVLGSADATLSGGQKARISLARAIYSGSDILLLDDPLAAIDVKVKAHIAQRVFGPQGLLRNSICIVTTTCTALTRLSKAHYRCEHGVLVSEQLPTARPDLGTQSKSIFASEDTLETKIDPTNDEFPHTKSAAADEITDIESFPFKRAQEETPEMLYAPGNVSLKIYLVWLRMAKPAGWILVALLTLGNKVSNVLSTYSLELLARHTGSLILRDIGFFTVIGLVQATLGWAFIVVTYQFCLLPASRKVHAKLAHGVIYSTMSFFHATPIGQILNRFTNDTGNVDGTLASNFLILLMMTANLLMIFAVLISTSLLAFAYLVPMAFIYYYLQEKYLRTVRPMRRMEADSWGPIITNIQEAVSGYESIILYGRRNWFASKQYSAINDNLRIAIPMNCLELWLAVRLELVGSCIQALSAAVLLYSNIDSAQLGFVMNYALQITGMLQVIVRSRVEMELDIVSIERIEAYAAMKPEGELAAVESRESSSLPVPSSWPEQATVCFESLSATYDGRHPCLEDINLEISEGSKVAVIGRTGAGKSSLALCISRMLEAADGCIKISGLDISQIDLRTLRSRISFIPQNPQVFTGTIRENLDPEHESDDATLWRALDKSQLQKFLKIDGDILDFKIDNGGKNLSSGQIQLLAVARVILSDNKILVLDEATSALDQDTDAALQRVFKTQFKDKTVITIAHRPSSTLASDKVLVIDKGRAVAFDSPNVLLSDKDSLFWQLVHEHRHGSVETVDSEDDH